MAGIVILNKEQLHTLALDIYRQEALAIQNINFKSEPERVKYLTDCKSNYESVLDLLKAGDELKKECEGDDVKSPIAHEIFEYIVVCANTAYQMVRNYTLRIDYVTKIKVSADSLMNDLKNLENPDEAAVKELAERAVNNRNAALEFTRKHQSPASRNFSRWLKETGITFEDLVKRYTNKRFGDRPFEDLEDFEKFWVYEDIIEASGRGRISVIRISMAFSAAGIAVLLFTAAMMVWDIFTSEHVILTITKDAVVTAASIGGAMLGEIVATAIATQFAAIEASAMLVTVIGFAAGFLGAFILGGFVGWLFSSIFGSGGTKFSTEGHHCYVAPMPDGEAMARQIAHA